MTSLLAAAANGPGPDCRPERCWHPCFNFDCKLLAQRENTEGVFHGELVGEHVVSCACPMRPVRDCRGLLKRYGVTDPLAALEAVRRIGGKVSDNAPSDAEVGDKLDRNAAIDRYFATVSDEEFIAALKRAGFKLTPINPDTQTAANADTPDCNTCPHRYAQEDRWQTIDDQVCGEECKPRTWHLHGADNMRYAPELRQAGEEARR